MADSDDPNFTGSDYFNSIGAKYEKGFGHNEGQINFVRASLDRLAPGASTRVLDVGVGTGRPTAAMVVASGRRLHGIDASSAMVEVASRQVPEGSYEVANMLEFMPSEPYDGVFAIFSLMQFTTAEFEGLATRWEKWVKPGGYLFIGTMSAESFPPGVFVPNYGTAATSGYVKRWFLDDFNRMLCYTKEAWHEMLDAGGFDIVAEEVTPFQPPSEFKSDWEPHAYITCRRRTSK